MDIKALPKASPGTLPEMDEYLTPFAALFRRSLTRQSVERYVTGLLTDLPRKTCDTLAAAVAGTSTERLQHLLTEADRDPVAMDKVRVQQLLRHSAVAGTLALDDTTFPKQGRCSVGISHQYCGMLGKIANCPLTRNRTRAYARRLVVCRARSERVKKTGGLGVEPQLVAGTETRRVTGTVSFGVEICW